MKSLGNQNEREQLRQRLLKVNPNSPRRWGKMSAHQMLCHLTDSFKAATGEKAVTPAASPLPRRLMRWFALSLPVPWPHGVPTRPEMDQQIGGTKPLEFDADRAALLAMMERFAQPQRDFEWHPHPLFGHMPERDWLRWGYLHVDHHLRQFGL